MPTLQDFIDLNEEIVALVRSGVPLELGLRRVSADTHGALAQIGRDVAHQLEQGARLDDAVAASGGRLPDVYRAVVTAGLRSGRLPAALETLSEWARVTLDLRRRLGLALIYPSIVVLCAYVLALVMLNFFVPEVRRMFETSFHEPPWILRILDGLRETLPYWGPVLPIVWLLLLGWWCGSALRPSLSPRWSNPLTFVPGVGGLLRSAHIAMFTDLLALLIEHRVPLTEALPLAAQAVGDPRLLRAVQGLVARHAAGQTLEEAFRQTRDLPAFVRWLVGSAETPEALVASLRQLATAFRARVERQAGWIQTVVPVGFVIVIGGGVTLLYALLTFVPLTQLLNDLSANS